MTPIRVKVSWKEVHQLAIVIILYVRILGTESISKHQFLLMDFSVIRERQWNRLYY